MANVSDLQSQVKSQILQRISDNFTNNQRVADGTQYTKSDGTNYGMYQKSDDFTAMSDIWQQVFSPAVNPSSTLSTTLAPGAATKAGGPATKTVGQ
jgi:hypothetical protein